MSALTFCFQATYSYDFPSDAKWITIDPVTKRLIANGNSIEAAERFILFDMDNNNDNPHTQDGTSNDKYCYLSTSQNLYLTPDGDYFAATSKDPDYSFQFENSGFNFDTNVNWFLCSIPGKYWRIAPDNFISTNSVTNQDTASFSFVVHNNPGIHIGSNAE